MAYLVLKLDDRPRLRKALSDAGESLVLGRAHDSDLVIDDHRLSRHHCRFERDPSERWTVIDLASTNGSSVNGERISSHRLSDGDEIEIGRTRIVFHEGAIPPRRPADPGESQIGMRAVNPSDTLVDSRVGVPGVVRPSPKPRAVEDASSRAASKGVPLAFQRPPAQPLVHSLDRASRPRGLRWLRQLFRNGKS